MMCKWWREIGCLKSNNWIIVMFTGNGFHENCFLECMECVVAESRNGKTIVLYPGKSISLVYSFVDFQEKYHLLSTNSSWFFGRSTITIDIVLFHFLLIIFLITLHIACFFFFKINRYEVKMYVEYIRRRVTTLPWSEK